MIISVVLTSEADGAGLVWRAINKSGSSIHDIANVTERGCALNQVLKVNSTADWACGTDNTGSGISDIVSAPATTAKLIQDNSTSSSKVSLKTLTQGWGISLTNNTSDIGINVTNPVTVLSDGNLTSVTAASYLTIFDIPLTTGTGNFISAYLIADTDTAGGAVQLIANTTGASNWGNCFYTSPTTATAQVVDVLDAIAGADTGETNIVNTNPQPLIVHCTVYATNAGNLKISFQPDATNVRVHILPGSYYIKSP